MFIELTRRTRDGKHKQQVRLDWIRNWRSDLSKGTQIEFTDGTDGFFDESPAAIRSALLKAGLLVVVEEEAKATKPPLEFPPASAVIDLSKTTIEGLCQAYAMWHGYPITDHPHDMRDAVIAELQRRIDAKPLRAVRNPTPLDDEAMKNAHVTGLCERYFDWNTALYEALDNKNDTRRAECSRELARIVLELQRRIESKPEQVVKLRQGYGNFVYCNGCCIAYEATTPRDARKMAEDRVRAINPSARIEWEDET